MPSYAAALETILNRETPPQGGTTGADVAYAVDGVPCTGYLARPAVAADPLPAVLVLHDWLGPSDTVRMRCDMLARLGYLAFAGDLYGDELRPGPADAAQAAGSFYGDVPFWRTRIVGAYERMLAEPLADARRTAAIGYCFGGSGALQLARTGAPLKAVVSFHGALSTGPEGEAERIRAKLLVLTGAIDPVVPDEAVQAFQEELRRVPVLDWQVITYSGAMHAFTIPDANSPDHGAMFDATAERRSWVAMRDFFAEVL
ncbi:dienelactone hydrolase family protein [Amnibacterium sp. CER49]|uniref:dienelactone hydrolase family protein n=1 Tax=Amnibacterium sp. CER49 TaxID=3039161 RepID=UPI00244BFFC4|nr:dienelactone hydrolase family protein [Amnibacterium sp. CER49]MDH2443289.1 dienelactone hydrolase family protein [Amnibacterium sp. CER49]